jgi:hypothetical protein
MDGKRVFPKKSSNILSISSLKEGKFDSHKPPHGVRAINNYLLPVSLFHTPLPETHHTGTAEEEMNKLPSFLTHLIK